MADITDVADTLAGTVVRSGPVEWIRTILRADAALCAASGVILAAAAGPLATLADGEPVGAVRAVGVFLVLVAADYALLSRLRAERLAGGAQIAAALNVAWVAATLGVIGAGLLEPAGAALALAGAVIAGGFAYEELVAAHRARRNQRVVESIAL